MGVDTAMDRSCDYPIGGLYGPGSMTFDLKRRFSQAICIPLTKHGHRCRCDDLFTVGMLIEYDHELGVLLHHVLSQLFWERLQTFGPPLCFHAYSCREGGSTFTTRIRSNSPECGVSPGTCVPAHSPSSEPRPESGIEAVGGRAVAILAIVGYAEKGVVRQLGLKSEIGDKRILRGRRTGDGEGIAAGQREGR